MRRRDSCSEMGQRRPKWKVISFVPSRGAFVPTIRGIDDKLLAMGRRLGDLAVRGEVRVAVFPRCQRW